MQQMLEAPRRHLQAEAGLQQVGDLGQRQAAPGVQLDDQRDHTGAELCAGRPQRVGCLQGVAGPGCARPTLRAVADLDVEAAHQRAHRGKVFLILRRRAGHFDRAAAVRTGSRRRCRQGLVDVRRARAASLLAIARRRGGGRDDRRRPCGRFLAKGAACRRPARRSVANCCFRCSFSRLQPPRSDAAGGRSHGVRPCGAPSRRAVARSPGPVAR